MIVMQIVALVALLLPKLCSSASMQCALQPGNALLHGSMMGGDTQMTASPKAPALPSTSLPPQAAHEAQALANASETLKAQAQTLKVGTRLMLLADVWLSMTPVLSILSATQGLSRPFCAVMVMPDLIALGLKLVVPTSCDAVRANLTCHLYLDMLHVSVCVHKA